MRVVLTGGGTGGHIYPAVAIGRDLQEKVPGTEILYVGTSKGLEADIVPKEGIPFRTVEVESLPRRLSLKTLRTGYKLVQGFWEARKVLRQFRPQVVIGTGGYVCGPVVLAAALMGIPAVIHEQNALPGITNKLLARFVKAVLLTFPESKRYFPAKARVEVTGLPIRPGIMAVSRSRGAREFGLDPGKFTLLVTGGSRGARSINLAVAEVLPWLAGRTDIQLIMATGTSTYQEFMTKVSKDGLDLDKTPNLVIRPYIYQMAEALASADLCICRAGAAFLAELLAKGKPSLLIPYPFAAENHQEFNARAVADKGGAVLILDKDLNGEKLRLELERLVQDKERLARMAAAARQMGKPEALSKITSAVLAVAERSG